MDQKNFKPPPGGFFIANYLKNMLSEIKTNNNIEVSTLNTEAPQIIDKPYPYVALNDLDEILPHLNSKINGPVVKLFSKKMFSLLEQVSPENTTFFTLNMKSANEKLNQIALCEISNNRGVILLDRYINPQIESDAIFRLELSRNSKGGLTTRPGGELTPEEQIVSLTNWIQESTYDEYIFMDDVLAFGDTLSPLIQLLKEQSENKTFRVITTIASSQGIWSGVEKLKEIGIEPEFLTLAIAGPQEEWTSGMALPATRDFTFLGGKITYNETGQSLSFPYFFPFSVPQPSFLLKESRLDASIDFLDLNIQLVIAINQEIDERLTIGDLINKGFGIPSTNIEELSELLPIPNPNTDLEVYLRYCQEINLQNSELISKIAQER